MYRSIGMPEFEQLWKKEKSAVLDVREADEFAWGHVKGARSLPLSQLEEEYPQLDKEQPYYVICQSGARSAAACQFLSQKGYRVTNVLGGFSAWRGETE